MARKHDLTDGEASDNGASSSRGKRQRTSPLPNSTPPAEPEPEQDDDQDDASEEEDDPMSDIEQTEEEQQALEEMKATQAIKQSSQRIAEAGVIQYVKLENFMCHYSTEVDFGPQVNFLVGVNGSGKSAILTGITMALGGNAKATNRGTKGGDLIMEGKPSAKCLVTLANRGEESYKPEIYGDEITIERTLNKSGGGGYKIKNSDGKTVDTKKTTLDAILDHFNLQVDNPMTVLTQDQSRQFLAKASAKDKYNFFLRGTQLAQLTEEYEQIRANTETMEEALQRKKEVLPELKEAYHRAKERAKDAEAAIEQSDHLALLNNQLAWSYVVQTEDQVEFAENRIAEEAAKGGKFESDLEALQAEADSIQNDIDTAKEAEAESQHAAVVNRPKMEELKQMIDANKARLNQWKATERQINGELGRLRAKLEEVERKIAIEEAKLSRDIEAERAPIREAIDDAQNEIVKIDINVGKKREEIDAGAEQYRQHRDQYDNINSQIANAEQQKSDAQGRLNNIKRAGSNPLNRYGNQMPQLVNAINQDQSWRQRPIGPIGLHVKLNEPVYGKMLESFFAHYLNGFVCVDNRDAARLRQLFRQFNIHGATSILTQEYDPNFDRDLANGEPNRDILTVLRAITIDNPLIKQALVNSSQIEKIALVPKRVDGDNLMRTDPYNVSVAHSADMFALRHSGGKSSSTSMSDWRGTSRLVADDSRQIAHLEGEIARIANDIVGLNRQKHEAGGLAASAERARKTLEDDIRKLNARKRELEGKIRKWTDKLNEEQPSNIAALQSMKEETEAEINNIAEQYKAALEAKQAEDRDVRPEVEQLTKLAAETKTAETLSTKIADHLAKAFGSLDGNKRKVNAVQREKDAHLARLERYREEVQQQETELENRREAASTICERPEFEKKKDPKRLQQEIASIEKALRAREKRQGATLDQIIDEMNVRKKVAQDAVKQTNDLSRLIKALEEAYENRCSKWTDFRAHICHRAKMQFAFYLANRGFHGKLKFDHDHTALHLAVQTDAADKGASKAKRKDASALSGGEKSFSTICLLLTMWEAVGCPLRCLDEFDVFMDAVNRRIAMGMMIDAAKAADQTQFILITPQDMGSMAWGPEVRVSKLGDPKRSQGTLAAGR